MTDGAIRSQLLNMAERYEQESDHNERQPQVRAEKPPRRVKCQAMSLQHANENPRAFEGRRASAGRNRHNRTITVARGRLDFWLTPAHDWVAEPSGHALGHQLGTSANHPAIFPRG
jgi:hypothetical protein